MLTILNRLRGTWAIMAKVNGLILGIGLYLLTGNVIAGIALAIAYVAGESMGWGKWIGGVIDGNKTATEAELADEEGRNNGIHWLANKIAPETEDYAKYCFVALAIRGVYWWLPVMLVLVYFGVIVYGLGIALAGLLGIAFPLSVVIANKTSKWFSVKFMNDSWGQAEVWYGIAQDIALVIVVAL